MENFHSISPIDGRYRKLTEPLSSYFSEKALIKYRIYVEAQYLLALSEHKIIRKVNLKEKNILENLCNVSDKDIKLVKNIETKGIKNISATRHDVKAVEYFIKRKLKNNSLKNISQWTHFALTSEDINNISYGLMIGSVLSQIILPALYKTLSEIDKLAIRYARTPLLAKTHGQPAVTTTFGKEFRNFERRLHRQISQLKKTEILVKLNGAVGNYNAHFVAMPQINWINFTRKFILGLSKKNKLKLSPNIFTTQIEPHDNLAEIFDNMRRINAIFIDFCQDIWRYISDGLIAQRAVFGEIGSSTMPQKVNPIDFENAEGNLGIANALFNFFASKLPVSRLQRDLSDSTVQRNISVAFAHSYIAYSSIMKGLSKISVNSKRALKEIVSCPEIIAEAIQTILKRENFPNAYEKIKELTRGKKLSINGISEFVDGLSVSNKLKKELKKIRPENYIGLSEKLAKK